MSSGRMRLLIILAAIVWSGSLLISPAAERETRAPEVRVLSPTPRDVMVGRSRIVAEASPGPGRLIVEVRIYVDGERVAVLTARPYEVVFDAGNSLSSRTLRVEADDDLGRTGVHFSATRYISYLERVEVEAEAVPRRSVLVTVLDRKAEPVFGLKPEDFTLHVDGKPEPLLEVAWDRRPLAVELQLDVSGSILPHLPLVKRAAENFVSLMDESDGVEVSLFAGSTLALSPFSRDHVATRETILGVLADTRKDLLLQNLGEEVSTEFNWSGSRVYDAMAYSVETINVRQGQRSIVVFTDGFDYGSRISRDQIFDVIRRSNLRIDAVRFGKPDAGDWSHDARQIKILKKLVQETGGQEWRIKYPEKIAPAFRLLARQLKARYRLVFAADPKVGPRERYRKLHVSVTRPHMRVLAPAGFYDGGTASGSEPSQD